MSDLITASRPLAAHAASSSRRSRPQDTDAAPSTIERVRDAVTTVFGCLGILTLAWIAASAIWGLGIIVFVTGSMAPSLPTGAAAITQTVAAEELEIGDVVTVRRPDANSQVTHRIVEIGSVAGRPDARSLTLKGDDNAHADLTPYIVDEAQRVIIGAPGVGWVMIWAKTPVVMLGGAVLIAVVVAWALWPTSSPRSRGSRGS